MKYYNLLFLSILLSLSACQKEQRAPKPSGTAPSELKEYNIINENGRVKIFFQITDENVSYVLAEYEPITGVAKQAKASKYSDSLVLVGFENAGDYEVSLFTVNETEKKSQPVTITVSPKTPAYILAFNTLEVGPTFGGITAKYQNTEEENLILEVIKKNDLDEWEVIERENSNNSEVRFVARGYSDEKKEFGFYLRDRWGNLSDTLFKEIKPFEENLIDMSNFYETNFPTDTYQGHLTGVAGGRKISFLFDGLFTQTRSWYTPPGSGIPMHFTIYLQDKYQLSRLKIWQRGGDSYYYQAANVKQFEVYGSNNPNPDGTWESWTLLKTFENIKPSGLPLGENSDVDNETAADGEDYEFDLDNPPVSYLRIKVLDTWGNQSFMYIAEMEIYGAKN